MYFFFCLMVPLSSGLTFKACLFYGQNVRWPQSPQELIEWRMRWSSQLIVGLWVAIWLLGGLSKPLGSLSSTGLIICLIASMPVVIFIFLWFAQRKK